jgi:hypothetical protein
LNLKLNFVLSLTLIALIVPTAYAQLPILVWSHTTYPSDTLDIAVSKDGQYVAAVGKFWSDKWGDTVGQIRFYGRASGTPLWTWTTEDTTGEEFYSVAISADGDSVVAGGMIHVFYWKNARSIRGTQEPTWQGLDVVIDSYETRCLDISDDGNYVVYCGPRDDYGIIYYWSDAKTRTETSVSATWKYSADDFFKAVDLSSNGDFVAAGFGRNVGYWKNARTLTGDPQNPDWISTKPNDLVVDLAVSDDGNYVAAAAGLDTVYYWSGANHLSGDPSSTWESGLETSFTSIDMSCDGDSVIAGTGHAEVQFWDGATGLSDTPPPTWTATTRPGARIEDVEMNDAGTYMAVVASVPTEDAPLFYFTAYFFDRVGVLKWEYPYPPGAWYTVSISLSRDGGSLAAGTSMPFTAYLFDTGFGSAPVGGYLAPVSMPAILGPYVALALLVLGIGAVTVLEHRKKHNS